MTTDEFWFGDPFLVQSYRKAQRFKDDRKNQELWLQGLYIYNAFAAVISMAFGKQGTKASYFNEPIDLHPEETEAKKVEEAKKKVVATLNAWKAAWDRAKQGEINEFGNS